MILSIILFAMFFPVNVCHFRYRKIPIYSAGTTFALIHLMVGMIHFAFIPAVSLIAVIVIELYVSGIDEKDKEEMEVKYNEEERNIKEKIEKAQSSYDNLHCLITYIAHSRVRILI